MRNLRKYTILVLFIVLSFFIASCQEIVENENIPTIPNEQTPLPDEETPIPDEETPIPDEETPVTVPSGDYVSATDLSRLTHMTIMPNLQEKINSTTQQGQLNHKEGSSILSLSSMIAEYTPFDETTSIHFRRTWIYMMVNEDIPLLQAWANNAKNQLDYIVNQITSQFDIANEELAYDSYYQLTDTFYFIKMSKLSDQEGINLQFVDMSETIQPGNFHFIEFQSYTVEEVPVTTVKFSLVAPYNTEHYISIFIENRADNYIQIHDITEYKDSQDNAIIAGRNFQFTFTENEFTIWRVDHGSYYPNPEDTTENEVNISFQVCEKNELNEVIDYNSSHFVTYLPDYLNPSDTITIFPDNNEVYISPFMMTNLDGYLAETSSSDLQITQITVDGQVIEGQFGDAFDLNDGSGRMIVDINNRYFDLDSKGYIEYLMSLGVDFEYDLLALYDLLITIHQTYPEKTAFGFQPLLSDENVIYDYFMTNYYVGRDFIDSIKQIIQS